MSPRILTLMIALIIGISPSLRADEGLVAKNGDRYAMVKFEHPDTGPFYELRRTSSQGETTILWSSTSLKSKGQATPTLSGIVALYEEGNEVSLLVLEGESYGWVFRFPVTVPTAAPIYIPGLIRSGDQSSGLRFKNHGELIFDSPKDSIEKVVRFNGKGDIVSDFRPRRQQSILTDPRVAVPPQTKQEPASVTFDQGSLSSQNLGSANSPSGQNQEPPVAVAVAPPLGSSSWPLWGGIMLGALALAYLFFKKREPQG